MEQVEFQDPDGGPNRMMPEQVGKQLGWKRAAVADPIELQAKPASKPAAPKADKKPVVKKDEPAAVKSDDITPTGQQ